MERWCPPQPVLGVLLMFPWWTWTWFETLVLVMLFVMTYTIARIDTYFGKSIPLIIDHLSWIRAHLDNLEHRDEHYLPKLFEAQINIEGSVDCSASHLENILTILEEGRKDYKKNRIVAEGGHLP